MNLWSENVPPGGQRPNRVFIILQHGWANLGRAYKFGPIQLTNGFLWLLLLLHVTGFQTEISKDLSGESKGIWLPLGIQIQVFKSTEIPTNMGHVQMCQLSTVLWTTEFLLECPQNCFFGKRSLDHRIFFYEPLCCSWYKWDTFSSLWLSNCIHVFTQDFNTVDFSLESRFKHKLFEAKGNDIINLFHLSVD